MRRLLPLFLAYLALAAPAAARTLYWAALEVDARLDAEGRLHIVERQAMVFDGAWNGGERTFRLEAGQKLRLDSVSRLEPASGRRIELEKGSLDEVDEYKRVDRNTLRWRSRLPDDPPFDDTRLVYELDYTLSGIVQTQDDVYLLNHDFAFADRFGDIERFWLRLELDPVWQPLGTIAEPGATLADGTLTVERSDVRPGFGVIVTLPLAYTGAGRPGAVARAAGDIERGAMVIFALVPMVLFWLRFRSHERAQGRYDAPDVPPSPGFGWLEENLLPLRAEEIGAIWDQRIGTPEVAATLARLVAEGKLASSVRETEGWRKRPLLELELLVDRDELGDDYERPLIDKLFFDGRTTTDTERVRKHYKKTGFSPVTVIRGELGKRLKKLPGFAEKVALPSWKRGGLLLLAAIGCFAIEAVTRSPAALQMIVMTGAVLFVPLLAAYTLALFYRGRADRLTGLLLGFLLPLAITAGGLLAAVYWAGKFEVEGMGRPGHFGLAGMAILAVAIVRSVFSAASTRDSREAVAARRRLAVVRRYFKSELTTERPRLRDEWLPYLLAFGLAKDVDRWSVTHGASSSAVSTTTYRGSSSPQPAASWSGGGGAFGGAGATAAWGAAATGLAAGVSSPSSGGSSGGGGSSSGGGGGGGW